MEQQVIEIEHELNLTWDMRFIHASLTAQSTITDVFTA
jgi:hypothetical protein